MSLKSEHRIAQLREAPTNEEDVREYNVGERVQSKVRERRLELSKGKYETSEYETSARQRIGEHYFCYSNVRLKQYNRKCKAHSTSYCYVEVVKLLIVKFKENVKCGTWKLENSLLLKRTYRKNEIKVKDVL